MKKLICLISLLFITSLVYAQSTAQIDSLELLLTNKELSIKERAGVHKDLVFFTYNNNEPKANYYKEQTQKLFQQSKDTLVLAHLMNICGLLCKEDKEGTIQKLEFAQKALYCYQKYNHVDGIISSYGQIVTALKRQNKIAEATNYLFKSITILEKQPYSLSTQTNILISYINLYGFLYLAKDPRAFEVLSKSVKLAEKVEDLEIKAHIFLNMSIAYREKQNYDSALHYAQKLEECAQLSKNDFFYLKSYQQLTQAYENLHNSPNAILYATKSVELAKKMNRINDVSLGLLLLGISQFNTKNYIESKKNLLEAKTLNLQQEKFDAVSKASNYLSKIYILEKQYDKIQAEIDDFIMYKDSVENRQNRTKLNELQTKYETEKKEQQIKDLEQQKTIDDLENKNQVASLQAQRSILGLVLLAPISLLVGGGWYVNRRRLHLKLEAEQKERAKQLSELKALRSQMNPHFIFNALNSIQDFILLSEKENASFYLGKFATLMRGFLESSSKEKISLDTELSLIKSYIELEGLRLGEEFNYEIIFDKIEEEELEDIEIPPLLIQPYLENAFKHGLLHKTGNKKLTLEFSKIEKSNHQFLELKITDNGVGRQKSAEINARKAKTHNSFATQATNERLELMKNQSTTNKNIEVKVNDLKDSQENAKGTEIVILIPIDND